MIWKKFYTIIISRIQDMRALSNLTRNGAEGPQAVSSSIDAMKRAQELSQQLRELHSQYKKSFEST
jgi:hypothetical protein